MGFTPENPLISHMNNFSWESRLVALRGLHAWRRELAEADPSPNRAVSEIA